MYQATYVIDELVKIQALDLNLKPLGRKSLPKPTCLLTQAIKFIILNIFNLDIIFYVIKNKNTNNDKPIKQANEQLKNKMKKNKNENDKKKR